jgi:hypothetical protein
LSATPFVALALTKSMHPTILRISAPLMIAAGGCTSALDDTAALPPAGGKQDCASADCGDQPRRRLDYNRDGHTDLLILRDHGPGPRGGNGEPVSFSSGRLYLYSGHGDGTFGEPLELAVGRANLGLLGSDLAVEGWTSKNGLVVLANETAYYLGTLNTPPYQSVLKLDHHGSRVIPIGDLDRDGIPDRIVGGFEGASGYGAPRNEVLIYRDRGAYPEIWQHLPAPTNVRSWGQIVDNAGDLDQDGYVDVVASGFEGAGDPSIGDHSLFVLYGGLAGFTDPSCCAVEHAQRLRHQDRQFCDRRLRSATSTRMDGGTSYRLAGERTVTQAL